MRAWIVTLALGSTAVAHAGEEERWLDELRERVAADVEAGKPLVVQTHVPLCDNSIIRCGGRGLGDGDDPDRNLYWATSGGFKGWFGRKGSGWKLVHDGKPDGDVLDVRVWKRTVNKGFDVYVVAQAWRGTAIDDALEAYVADLYGGKARTLTLDDGTVLQAGGAAQVVAYVGHNRWMDRAPYEWDALPDDATKPKGTIALACKTKDYLADEVPAATRVPLLMTDDFLFAGAHAFEGAVWAFATGGDYAEIRDRAAGSYADGQGKSKQRVKGAFTNPSDKRWRRAK